VYEKRLQNCGKKLNVKRTNVKASPCGTKIGKGIKEKDVNASEMD
jgi:hypothetical protein